MPCGCQNGNSRESHCLKQHLMTQLLFQLRFYDDILHVVNDVEAASRYLLISHDDSSVIQIVGRGKGHSQQGNTTANNAKSKKC